MPDPAQGRRAPGTGPRKEAGRHTGAGPAAAAQKEVNDPGRRRGCKGGDDAAAGEKSNGGRSAADPFAAAVEGGRTRASGCQSGPDLEAPLVRLVRRRHGSRLQLRCVGGGGHRIRATDGNAAAGGGAWRSSGAA